MSQCVIINLSEPWQECPSGSMGNTLAEKRRPKYVHDDLESAEAEALRLHKQHAGPAGRFVIFQAVQATTWRKPWEIAASTVAVLEPIELPVAELPERAPKKKRKKQA